MATYSSILAWRIPGMREPVGLLSMGSHKVGHDWSDLAAAAGIGRIKMSCPSTLGYCQTTCKTLNPSWAPNRGEIPVLLYFFLSPNSYFHPPWVLVKSSLFPVLFLPFHSSQHNVFKTVVWDGGPVAMAVFSKMPPGSFTPQAGSIRWVSESRKDSPQTPAEAVYKGVGTGGLRS